MKLVWKGNQKYNEDISKATIRTIEQPLHMSIHKYIGCSDELFFDCKELGINCIDLKTEDFDEAEEKAMEVLEDRCKYLMSKVESVISDYNDKKGNENGRKI